MARYSDEFGEAVRGAMGRRSAREVARLTGGEVSHTLIYEIRNNGYVPGAEVIVTLARALNVDPNALLDAAGKPKYLRYIPETAGSVRQGLTVGLRPAAVSPAP